MLSDGVLFFFVSAFLRLVFLHFGLFFCVLVFDLFLTENGLRVLGKLIQQRAALSLKLKSRKSFGTMTSAII